MANSLLGLVTEEGESTKEEDDLKNRSSKKVKAGVHGFTGAETGPVSYMEVYQGGPADGEGTLHKSYKGSLLGQEAIQELADEDDDDSMDDSMDGSEETWYTDESDEDESQEGMSEEERERRIEVIEKKRGSYDCPAFKLSKKEEHRIREPWRQAVIVKLLGRRIGFKALEDRFDRCGSGMESSPWWIWGTSIFWWTFPAKKTMRRHWKRDPGSYMITI